MQRVAERVPAVRVFGRVSLFVDVGRAEWRVDLAAGDEGFNTASTLSPSKPVGRQGSLHSGCTFVNAKAAKLIAQIGGHGNAADEQRINGYRDDIQSTIDWTGCPRAG